MKKVIVCILFLIFVFAAVGCGQADTAFLTSVPAWYHYDEVTGESEKMSFSEDGSFYWGCECGEPVGNSDVYELYEYDKETDVITLYNGYDDCRLDLKLIDYSDYHLLVEVDGEIKDYTCLDGELNIAESEKYLAGYNMYASIIEGDSKTLVLGPFNYDGDVEYPDNAFRTYGIADDAEFYDFQIATVVKGGSESQDITYKKMTGEEAEPCMEYGYGFLWFNDDLKVTKIVFYGETRVEY